VTYRQVDLIEVWYHGDFVGAVAADPSTGRYVFQYSPEWVGGGIELSPLHMRLRPESYELAMWPELSDESFKGLPPLLADSLPDAFGNALVNQWMAEHGVSASEITTLDRLGYVADRAMGALEYRPAAREDGDEAPSAIQLADLVLAARCTLRGELADSDDAYGALQQLIEVGSSAGGARPKALIAFHPLDYRVHSPFLPLESGFEHWLIKLDGVDAHGTNGSKLGLGDSAPYGRIEYAYYLMAQAAEVNMSESRLLEEGPRRHFLTRRFDRGPSGEKYHVLSLSAMANLDQRAIGAHSYDQYLSTIAALNLSPDDLHQAYRRMVFNVMAANRDDHTKNFAFLLDPEMGWTLAPAYDITHAYVRDNRWLRQHNLTVNGKTEQITVEDLEIVGERQFVPGYRRAIREVRNAIEDWPAFAAIADVDPVSTGAITQDIKEVQPT
jgi:serine/threonine-protein kinase HipA